MRIIAKRFALALFGCLLAANEAAASDPQDAIVDYIAAHPGASLEDVVAFANSRITDSGLVYYFDHVASAQLSKSCWSPGHKKSAFRSPTNSVHAANGGFLFLLLELTPTVSTSPITQRLFIFLGHAISDLIFTGRGRLRMGTSSRRSRCRGNRYPMPSPMTAGSSSFVTCYRPKSLHGGMASGNNIRTLRRPPQSFCWRSASHHPGLSLIPKYTGLIQPNPCPFPTK